MTCCLTHWFSKLLNLKMRSEMTAFCAVFFVYESKADALISVAPSVFY